MKLLQRFVPPYFATIQDWLAKRSAASEHP